MLRTTVMLLFTWGCLDAEEPATGTIEAAAIGERCPSHICGMNADDQIDGGFFYELHTEGLANSDGWFIWTAMKGLAPYRLEVVNGKIAATRTAGIGTPTLAGTALVGLRIRLRRELPTGPDYRTIEIESVSRVTDFWAQRLDGQPTPVIESYKFHIETDNGFGAYMCQNGALLSDTTSPFTKMPEHHALVFEGDRINIDRLTVSSGSTKWFTIGCAKSVLAKLHLTGHTRAAAAAGFTTTVAERQTMLKMLTADYCGTGRSFTVRGQSLFWTDHRGTLAPPSSESKVIEARWTPSGASCLNTPRVAAHPTEASESMFPFIEGQISHQCDRPPPCPLLDTVHHLVSWNPTPFTN
jgi:hypothetical protein